MAYMFVRQSVQDYEAWKSVFDSFSDLRKRNGEKSYQILRQDNGSSEVVGLFEWDNLDNARKYAGSPELKAAMERTGVTGKPEILFLEEAARGYSMNKIELARAAFDLDDPDQYSHYSDDFQFTDELGNPPLDKDTFIAGGQPVRSAVPDLAEVIEDIREEGDDVVVTSHFSGTFTNDLDLSAMGLGVVRATGKAVVWPTGSSRLSFDDGKVSEMHGLDTGPNAGLPGFLRGLGVDLG
ncbi:MAG: nuclear transport factor 2 family protein [Phycisphaerales bacterium]|nr:MAG: nuclear transport factor 2 family protein [Phycisphaerales bacterium]